MIKEAIEKIERLIEQTAEPWCQPEMETRNTYWIRRSPTGELERIQALLPARDHRALSVDGFIRAITLEHSGRFMLFAGDGQAQCLVFEEPTELYDQGEKLPTRIRFNLNRTETFKTIAELTGQRFDQERFVRLLQFDLFECKLDGLVELFRKLKFVNHEEGDGEIQQGSTRVNKRLLAKLASDGEAIPESITLQQVRVYEESEYTTDIEAHVGVDPVSATDVAPTLSGADRRGDARGG